MPWIRGVLVRPIRVATLDLHLLLLPTQTALAKFPKQGLSALCHSHLLPHF